MQVRKQQLELDMEQQTGSKQEKEYVKAVYCHPAYLTYMQRIHMYTEVLAIEKNDGGAWCLRPSTASSSLSARGLLSRLQIIY